MFGRPENPFPATSAWTQNTTAPDIQIWFDYYIKISNNPNQNDKSYMEWTAGIDSFQWPTSDDMSLAELRIQEVNKDSVGH